MLIRATAVSRVRLGAARLKGARKRACSGLPKNSQGLQTGPYLADAERLFDDDERAAIVDLIADDPQCGVVIPGTGGVRKVRVAASGRGKSGGARVIYLFGGGDVPIFLLAVFAKNEKADLTPAERNELKKSTAALLKSYRGEP